MTEIKQINKPQEESKNKTDGKQIRLSTVKNQKYLVQRKGSHVVTFGFEPELKDLLSYGPGTYTVMFTKPSFAFCKSITVPVPKEKTRLSGKKPLPTTQNPPKMNSASTPHIKDNNIEPSLPSPLPPPSKPVVASYSSPVQIEPSRPVFNSEPEEEEFEISRCHHCNCNMTIICLINQSKPKICEFCNQEYCSKKCYSNHKCETSYACFHCQKRFPKEYYIKNRFCGKLFCTLQCAFQCQEKNEDKNECFGCGDYLEEFENGELMNTYFERPEPEIECSNCDATGEDFDPGIFCYDCDEEDCVYCSWECFHEAHNDMEERHKGVRFEDLPDP